MESGAKDGVDLDFDIPRDDRCKLEIFEKMRKYSYINKIRLTSGSDLQT